MAKASFTLVFFLFATLFAFVSARPLERRDVSQFKEDLNHVTRSIDMFDHSTSFLDAVSPDIFLVGLEAISSGFGECANDLDDVDYIPDGDSGEILQQMQGLAPTFVDSITRMAAVYQTPHGLATRDVGKAIRDIGRTLNNLANNLRRTVNDLAGKTRNKRQKAAYKQVGNQMLTAVQNASPSQ